MIKKLFLPNGTKKQKSKKDDELNVSKLAKVYFDSTNTYEILDFWSDFTGWEFDDFPTILSLTKIALPIVIYDFESQSNKLLCKDANNVLFSISFDFFSYTKFSYSSLIIEYEKEKFQYTLNNKTNFSNDFPNLTLKFHDKVTENNSKYSLAYNVQNDSITQSLNVDNESLYTVEINLWDKSKRSIMDRILSDENLKMTFDNLKISHSLLANMIKNLDLIDEDLEALIIKVTFTSNNKIVSKIVLRGNVITEVTFVTNEGYLNLFADGKLLFHSLDGNISIEIKDISKELVQNPTCIDKFDTIIKDANKMLEEMDILLNF